MFTRVTVGVACVLGCLGGADGGVITFYDVFKTQQRVQLDDTTLSPVIGWYFSARVFTNEALTIAGAEVWYDGPESVLTLGTTDDVNFGSSFAYWSQEELDAAFPSTTYTFTIFGGAHDQETAALGIAADMYPDTTPMLVNGSYAALQAVDAASGYVGEISGWSPPAQAEYGLTYVFVSDGDTGEILDLTVTDPTVTEIEIPAEILEPDHAYRLDIVYSARMDEQNLGLDGAYGVIGFDTRVFADFTTLPAPSCVGDINGDGQTNVSDFNILASHFAQSVAPYANGDLTGDGVVNVSDFNILAGNFRCGVD